MTKKQTTKRAGKARGTTTKKGAKGTPATPRPTRARDPRLPAPGTTITRTFKGKELRLTVLDGGFRFDGEVYRSLTATALKATGYPAVSGPHFWKLDAAAAATPKRAATSKKGATAKDAATLPEKDAVAATV
jgi:hypothetical protein